MSEPLNKKLKLTKKEGGSRNSTPNKKALPTTPENRFSAFSKTFVDDSDALDDFEVVPLDLRKLNKQKKEKVELQLVQLKNIPAVWTVRSLAKMFDVLYDIYGNKSHKSGELIVKALIEMALTQDWNLINEAFAPESATPVITSGTSTPTKSSIEALPLNTSTPAKLQDKKNPRDFLAKFIGKATGDTGTNFKSCYMQTNFWASYDLTNLRRNLVAKHATQAVLSWLSSYIILQAYGNHPEVRDVYNNPTYEELKNVWERKLGNVYAHYQKFYYDTISDCLQWEKRDFRKAGFLLRVGEDKNDICRRNFIDDKDVQDYAQSSVDIKPDYFLKRLIEHVVAKTDRSTEDTTLRRSVISDGMNTKSMEMELCNLVTGQNAFDKHHKKQLQDNAHGLEMIRKKYMQYRMKEGLPQSCPMNYFVSDVAALIDLNYGTRPDRPNAKEEVFEDDCNFVRLKRITVEAEQVRMPPSKMPDYLSGKNNCLSVPIDYIEVKKKDESAESQASHEDVESPKVDQGVVPLENKPIPCSSKSAENAKMGAALDQSDIDVMNVDVNEESVTPNELDPSAIVAFGLTNFEDLIKIPVGSNVVSNDENGANDKNLIEFHDGDNYGHVMDDLLSDL